MILFKRSPSHTSNKSSRIFFVIILVQILKVLANSTGRVKKVSAMVNAFMFRWIRASEEKKPFPRSLRTWFYRMWCQDADHYWLILVSNSELVCQASSSNTEEKRACYHSPWRGSHGNVWRRDRRGVVPRYQFHLVWCQMPGEKQCSLCRGRTGILSFRLASEPCLRLMPSIFWLYNVQYARASSRSFLSY